MKQASVLCKTNQCERYLSRKNWLIESYPKSSISLSTYVTRTKMMQKKFKAKHSFQSKHTILLDFGQLFKAFGNN